MSYGSIYDSHGIEIKRRFQADDFPLRLVHMPAQGQTLAHRHDFRELVVVLAGRGLQAIDGRQYPIESGDVFILSEDQVHSYLETEDLELINMLFQPHRLPFLRGDVVGLVGFHALFNLSPYFREFDVRARCLQLSSIELAQVAGILSELSQELATCRPGWQTMAMAAFMRLVTTLSRAYDESGVSQSPDMTAVGHVLAAMEQESAKQWTLDELASMAYMSRRNFQRIFREAIGASPMQHLIGIRIANACDLLANGMLSIKEIAAICGYSDVNYFVRQFRQRKGMSPKRYRQHTL